MPDSTHKALLDAAEARLAALDLGGLESRISRRGVLDGAWGANLTLPCLVVSYMGIESDAGGLTGQDDDTYPLTVWIVLRDESENPNDANNLLKWRSTIKKAFRHKPFDTVVPNIDISFNPSVVIDPRFVRQEYQFLVSVLSFSCLCREARS